MTSTVKKLVIAGLDPAIRRATRILDSLTDAQVKPAHDELKLWRVG
jgi:hypothetical protein